jgi:DNA topoisomerase-1
MPTPVFSATSLGELQLAALGHDAESTASAAELVHVTDQRPGIARKRVKEGFTYTGISGTVKDRPTLDRIKALAIPPAWSDVWICPLPNGHLQATGKDAKGRKQYRYHARWTQIRGLTKFVQLLDFGKRLPQLRKHVRADLRRRGMPREKVLAGVVALMESTRVRVGNSAYERQNHSYGLSTLKDRHVRHSAQGTRLKFVGKSGIVHDIALHNATLARLVMRCKELPGQDLFQYKDDEGTVHAIDSDMVNTYIRVHSGGDFTSKDLRTWMGTTCCIRAMLEIGPASTVNACRQKVNAALDEVALHLGNTRAVCRRSYVDPRVIRAYEHDGLVGCAKGVVPSRGTSGYSREERVLLKLLRKART